MLKDKPQFCCWKYEERSGRKTKVPYNPVTGKRAKPNQRGTFKDFSSAVAAISDYDGMGFLVGNDICVIGLDDCFDSKGSKHYGRVIHLIMLLPVKLIWHFAVCWHFGVAGILDRWTDFSGRAA